MLVHKCSLVIGVAELHVPGRFTECNVKAMAKSCEVDCPTMTVESSESARVDQQFLVPGHQC